MAFLKAVEHVDLCDLPFARLDCDQVVDHVFALLNEGNGGWIVTANVDFVYRSLRKTSLRDLYAAADLIVADGLPLVWAARLRGTPLAGRVAGSDLVWLLAERAAREQRSLYLLGGDPGVSERAAGRLRERYPSLRIVGWSSLWLPLEPDAQDCAPIAEELARLRPDLVYVALGTPKQEYLIARLRETLRASVMIGVGISLSFISGDVRRAPKLMQRAGIEWLYRLCQEPRRLARRYLVADLPFVLWLLASSCATRWRG